MTEDEARNKWCPMARVRSTTHGPKTNLPGSNAINCIGADCMAWRVGWKVTAKTEEDDTFGYCGLAGKP